MSFYAIGIDPTESLAELVRYQKEQGYPWPVATAPEGMLPAYNITIQSTKVAIGADGVITFREGYGVKPPETWRQVFQRLMAR